MFALQYVFSALKSTSDNLNAELILYPYVFTTKSKDKGMMGTSILINDMVNCKTSIEKLEYMAYNVSIYQSEDTRSYEAFEFLEKGGATADDVTVSVVTLSYTPSDQVKNTITSNSDQYSLKRINASIAKIKSIQPSTRFFSVGVNIEGFTEESDKVLYDEELLALSDNIPERSTKLAGDEYLDEIFNLLEAGSVLCENQGM